VAANRPRGDHGGPSNHQVLDLGRGDASDFPVAKHRQDVLPEGVFVGCRSRWTLVGIGLEPARGDRRDALATQSGIEQRPPKAIGLDAGGKGISVPPPSERLGGHATADADADVVTGFAVRCNPLDDLRHDAAPTGGPHWWRTGPVLSDRRRSARSPGASMALGCSVGGAACGTKADHRAATDSADDDGQSTDVQHLVHQVSCMDAPCTDADDSRSKTFGSTEVVGPLRTRLHLLRSGWRRALRSHSDSYDPEPDRLLCVRKRPR
jgi:hypothetical protein